MNYGLKNELSTFAALGALAFYLGGKKTAARNIALAAALARALPLPKYDFANKSVVITGGSRGLGFALATELAKQGAYITLLARDAEELQRAEDLLDRLAPDKIATQVCDITQADHLATAFATVAARFGGIDVLINNAGSVAMSPLEATTRTDFDAQMNLHFFAAMSAVELAVPYLKRSRGGRIINISSIGGKIPIPHMSSYNASKFALSGYSKAAAIELRRHGITVTAIHPGLMRTGSTIQAVFKGDAQKEYAWFTLAASTPGISMSAERAARQILRASQEGRSEATIGLPAQLAAYFHQNFPETFLAAMSVVNRVLPQENSHLRRTGAASRDWFDHQLWTLPLRWLRNRAEKKFNQMPKYDAEYNLNATTAPT